MVIDRKRLQAAFAAEQERFLRGNPRSAALFDRARKSLLGGVPMSWMGQWAGSFPLFVEEASGASVRDVDAHAYLDLCLGDTGAMTGHAPPKAIEALVKCGALGSTGATRKGMLEVLEQAQAKGQKIQQDALIGQGSIFDLQEDLDGAEPGVSPGRGAGAGLVSVHPPIPGEEFDQPQLLAAEKEAIGLFVSAHPLKPLREALRARVDCPLSAIEDRRDKDWVTVGGIITETSASISPRSSIASRFVSARMNSQVRPSGGLIVRTGRPITQVMSSGRTP